MIKKITLQMLSIYRNILINIKLNCNIHIFAKLNNKTILKGCNIIHTKTNIENSYIGYGTYIGPYCRLPKTLIGKFCSIADNVKIIVGNHPVKKIVSTHPLFYNSNKFCGISYGAKNIFDEYTFCDENKKYYCEIGNDVWISTDVKILSGVKIGDGAIIATGAVVTKDVPPYAIIGGVPAKVIKYRFSEDEIQSLLKYRWWEKDQTWIRKNIEHFSDISEFIRELI